MVFSLDANSTPGPDGFNSTFFQKCWHIIVGDLMDAVGHFLEGEALPRGVTSTYIFLISKKQSPLGWSDYRPISLCNTLNKIITKVLNNRIKLLLPKLISPEQGGFVPGRLINENILLAQETIQGLNRKVRGGNLILKLDMAKAFDRISWSFIAAVLRAFGFPVSFVNLISKSINNNWFSVLLNGTPTGYFKSTGESDKEILCPLPYL